MRTAYAVQQHNDHPIPHSASGYRVQKKITALTLLLYLAAFMVVLYLLTGCSGPTPHRLQTYYERESHVSKIIQEKIASHSHGRLPVGTVIVLQTDPPQEPASISESAWPQFAAIVRDKIQTHMPVSLKEAVRMDEAPSGGHLSLMTSLGENTPIEMVLVVLPSSNEIKGPAKFDLLPEVSLLNGYQTENHTTVELGLLDYRSGKLLLQSQGASYATLDQLDVPLASNRYPRVRGSSMTNPIYPDEDRALETLRMVALNEALDQAVMKLAGQWPADQRGLSKGAGMGS